MTSITFFHSWRSAWELLRSTFSYTFLMSQFEFLNIFLVAADGGVEGVGVDWGDDDEHDTIGKVGNVME